MFPVITVVENTPLVHLTVLPHYLVLYHHRLPCMQDPGNPLTLTPAANIDEILLWNTDNKLLYAYIWGGPGLMAVSDASTDNQSDSPIPDYLTVASIISTEVARSGVSLTSLVCIAAYPPTNELIVLDSGGTVYAVGLRNGYAARASKVMALPIDPRRVRALAAFDCSIVVLSEKVYVYDVSGGKETLSVGNMSATVSQDYVQARAI